MNAVVGQIPVGGNAKEVGNRKPRGGRCDKHTHNPRRTRRKVIATHKDLRLVSSPISVGIDEIWF